MTSLPISSKTKTFHAASSPDGADGSVAASSWASMSVMGALRLRMRLMLARGSSQPFSTRRQRRAYLFACLAASWPWWARWNVNWMARALPSLPHMPGKRHSGSSAWSSRYGAVGIISVVAATLYVTHLPTHPLTHARPVVAAPGESSPTRA